MALENEKYVLFTSYRRDGTPVMTPVWVVSLGGTMYGFWTSSASGKAKRLAHTTRVELQPCNARGCVKPRSNALEGTARVVTGGELEAIRKKVIAKYGVSTTVTRAAHALVGLIRGKRLPYGDLGVVVTLAL